MISDERLKELADDNTICKVSWDERVGMARELLALRKAHEGWQLVPVEPTTEMLEEIWLDERFKEVAMKRRYQALLAAAPSPHK